MSNKETSFMELHDMLSKRKRRNDGSYKNFLQHTYEKYTKSSKNPTWEYDEKEFMCKKTTEKIKQDTEMLVEKQKRYIETAHERIKMMDKMMDMDIEEKRLHIQQNCIIISVDKKICTNKDILCRFHYVDCDIGNGWVCMTKECIESDSMYPCSRIVLSCEILDGRQFTGVDLCMIEKTKKQEANQPIYMMSIVKTLCDDEKEPVKVNPYILNGGSDRGITEFLISKDSAETTTTYSDDVIFTNFLDVTKNTIIEPVNITDHTLIATNVKAPQIPSGNSVPLFQRVMRRNSADLPVADIIWLDYTHWKSINECRWLSERSIPIVVGTMLSFKTIHNFAVNINFDKLLIESSLEKNMKKVEDECFVKDIFKQYILRERPPLFDLVEDMAIQKHNGVLHDIKYTLLNAIYTALIVGSTELGCNKYTENINSITNCSSETTLKLITLLDNSPVFSGDVLNSLFWSYTYKKMLSDKNIEVEHPLKKILKSRLPAFADIVVIRVRRYEECISKNSTYRTAEVMYFDVIGPNISFREDISWSDGTIPPDASLGVSAYMSSDDMNVVWSLRNAIFDNTWAIFLPDGKCYIISPILHSDYCICINDLWACVFDDYKQLLEKTRSIHIPAHYGLGKDIV